MDSPGTQSPRQLAVEENLIEGSDDNKASSSLQNMDHLNDYLPNLDLGDSSFLGSFSTAGADFIGNVEAEHHQAGGDEAIPTIFSNTHGRFFVVQPAIPLLDQWAYGGPNWDFNTAGSYVDDEAKDEKTPPSMDYKTKPAIWRPFEDDDVAAEPMEQPVKTVQVKEEPIEKSKRPCPPLSPNTLEEMRKRITPWFREEEPKPGCDVKPIIG